MIPTRNKTSHEDLNYLLAVLAATQCQPAAVLTVHTTDVK